MNRGMSLAILSLIFISMIGIVSAESTIVNGTIYQDVITNGIKGANVTVICHHNANTYVTDYTLTTTSGTGGIYSVSFDNTLENFCSYIDIVAVNAEWCGSTATGLGTIYKYDSSLYLTLNLGISTVNSSCNVNQSTPVENKTHECNKNKDKDKNHKHDNKVHKDKNHKYEVNKYEVICDKKGKNCSKVLVSDKGKNNKMKNRR
jgi:hypothetical protein